MFGWPEILVVLLILLLVFGASRLPELARAIGKSFGALKEGMREGREDLEEELNSETAPREETSEADPGETKEE